MKQDRAFKRMLGILSEINPKRVWVITLHNFGAAITVVTDTPGEAKQRFLPYLSFTNTLPPRFHDN